MPRLIDVRSGDALPATLDVEVGDILIADASGARVSRESQAVVVLGILSRAVVADDGRVLAPEGPPNAVALHAVGSGAAEIELMLGDPFGAASQARLRIVVRERPGQR